MILLSFFIEHPLYNIVLWIIRTEFKIFQSKDITIFRKYPKKSYIYSWRKYSKFCLKYAIQMHLKDILSNSNFNLHIEQIYIWVAWINMKFHISCIGLKYSPAVRIICDILRICYLLSINYAFKFSFTSRNQITQDSVLERYMHIPWSFKMQWI